MLCTKCAKTEARGEREERRREGKRADENFAEKNLIFKCAKLLMRKLNNNSNSTGK